MIKVTLWSCSKVGKHVCVVRVMIVARQSYENLKDCYARLGGFTRDDKVFTRLCNIQGWRPSSKKLYRDANSLISSECTDWSSWPNIRTLCCPIGFRSRASLLLLYFCAYVFEYKTKVIVDLSPQPAKGVHYLCSVLVPGFMARAGFDVPFPQVVHGPYQGCCARV